MILGSNHELRYKWTSQLSVIVYFSKPPPPRRKNKADTPFLGIILEYGYRDTAVNWNFMKIVFICDHVCVKGPLVRNLEKAFIEFYGDVGFKE